MHPLCFGFTEEAQLQAEREEQERLACERKQLELERLEVKVRYLIEYQIMSVLFCDCDVQYIRLWSVDYLIIIPFEDKFCFKKLFC